jgi:hypothetical protein
MSTLHNDGAPRRAHTYPVPTTRALDDSERNQLAELRHEGCEAHCDECGRCDWEPTGPTTTRTVPMTEVRQCCTRHRRMVDHPANDPCSPTEQPCTTLHYCPDCLPEQYDLIPETWRPEPDPADGYLPGPEIAGTYGDVTLSVQRTHLHPDRAAYYWRIMLEGHHAPAADGTVVALDPTMTTRSVALALAWNLYASEAARAIAGDSPILIHHSPDTDPVNIARCQDEIHEIHMEMS